MIVLRRGDGVLRKIGRPTPLVRKSESAFSSGACLRARSRLLAPDTRRPCVVAITRASCRCFVTSAAADRRDPPKWQLRTAKDTRSKKNGTWEKLSIVPCVNVDTFPKNQRYPLCFSICACHPCAGAALLVIKPVMLIFSVSFHCDGEGG